MKSMSTDLFKIENPLPLPLMFYEFHEELMVLNCSGWDQKNVREHKRYVSWLADFPHDPSPPAQTVSSQHKH